MKIQPAASRNAKHVSRLVGIASVLVYIVSVGHAQMSREKVLVRHVPEAVRASRAIGPISRWAELKLAIGLPLRNQDQLDRLIEDLYNPDSPRYRQYLAPEEFAAQFAPLESDYSALAGFLESNGLRVLGTHPNRTILDVAGSVADIEKTFHLKMLMYEHPARGRYFAPDRDPSVAADLPILDITGLDNFVQPRPMDLTSVPLASVAPLVTGSGPAGLFIGKDFRAAYAPGVTLTGAGQTVGLIEFDGFFAADVQANFKQAGMTPVPVQTVLLDGFSGAAGSSNVEVTLDIMMAAYMAPGLSKIIVYEGTNPNDILNRMATDNLAKQLSSSWGFWPINSTTEQIYKQIVAQGQSFFQASGDSGSYSGAVMPPSDNPNLTVVGGTSLTTAGSGGAWLSETTWKGSGGGISTTYPIPSYQQGLATTANLGSTTMRNIPDVALTADIQMFLICNNGYAAAIGGTSAAAPLWAGFAALANQQAVNKGKPAIGFLNPLIYAIGKGSSYGTDLHDIKSGNNGGFASVAGFDLATGWGTPAGQHLIDDLTAVQQPASFSLSAASPTVAIKRPGSASVSMTITPMNGFKGSVSLAVSGLPSGVTAQFSPVTTTNTSTLTLTAAATANAGTSTLAVTGTSGTLTSSANITLTVTAPSYTLSATPATATVIQGSNITATIAVAPTDGFTGSVSLTATGLPSGVTAAFSPAAATDKSTLTLSAGASAALGTASITVNGNSGGIAKQTTIRLTVAPPPSFSLSVAPATVSVFQGASAAAAVTVTPLNGFSGTVSLTVSGLPTGVTASFSASSAKASAIVTLTATTAAALKTSAITITGTSASLTRTATLSVAVVAPSSATALVNLWSVYNVNGIVADGTVFSNSGGLDGGGRAYSANLLGTSQTIGGTTFVFGPAGGASAVSSKSIALPAGQFTTLKLLATAVNGNQPSQVFTVKYSDGTTSSFTQSLSDWYTPQNYPGESKAVTMAYRDNSVGTADYRTFLLYAYSFSLNAAKTVSSITLPTNGNVVVLSISLSSQVVPQQVSLSTLFNTTGVTSDGKPFTGGLDGVGNAYSAKLLASAQTFNGASLLLGPADGPNAVTCKGQAVILAPGKYSSLVILATAVNGSQPSQTFKVTYSDGGTATFSQSFSDWFQPQGYPGEGKAVQTAYRNTSAGGRDNRTFYLYGYVVPLDKTKTVTSLTLPNNANLEVLAFSLVP